MRHDTRRRGFAIALSLIALVLLVLAPGASAELTEHGDLFVRFHGGIAPTALPRHELAPISVGVGGAIKTLSGSQPPALRTIKIELNRSGRLDARGLPKCRYGELIAASPARAMANCGGALVGEGAYAAKTAFPEQETFPTEGHILAFNGVFHGQEAILAHIYGGEPVPIARLVVFHVHRRAGTYGTVITGRLSATLNHYGYITMIALRLHRTYRFRGQARSYLSAACAAPPGFPGASFPFARASMSFADGRRLSSTLVRSCRVSG
jgi:hypothetical protein